MNKDEVLRLALEALEANLGNWSAKRKAIPIIKQALKQSVADSNTSKEHVAKIEKTQHERKWVGLTEREVDECYNLVMFDMNIEPSRLRIYQAIEAKLKGRNT